VAGNESAHMSSSPGISGDQSKRRATSGEWQVRAQWLARCLAIGLGAILVRSSMFHVENSYAFLLSLDSYKLVPPPLAPLAAAIMPYLQLTVGMMLLFFPASRPSAFGWCATMCLLFALVQAIAYARGLNISCGCFSPSADNPIGLRSIGLAVIASVAAVCGWLLTARQTKS
jgi:putative oxidoreductase